MGDMRARVAYLRGLLSGLGVNDDSREARLFQEMTKVLNDFADAIEELQSAQEDTEEYLRALDEDLYTVEAVVFGDEDEEDRVGVGEPEELTAVAGFSEGEIVASGENADRSESAVDAL